MQNIPLDEQEESSLNDLNGEKFEKGKEDEADKAMSTHGFALLEVGNHANSVEGTDPELAAAAVDANNAVI